MGAVRLPDDLTIYQVTEIKAILLKALREYERRNTAIELDFSNVKECDGAGVQLLLALSNSAAKAGATVALHSVPKPLAKLLDDLQLSSRFLVNS
ncbi:STAS domain-containing protein [Methylocucumis oryzae]|uniref:STAS domain-containing protein n=1 Tax=Methylocucumis oryzae TaxID=1632867 RepID=A0A0F3IMP7_9GAMM|nr:STAS domain-containing protein [Methylocucumis oryzae]KJV07803.1 hypothetical protein VZ94_02215 [Methylocucumis oryzae]